MSQLEQPLSFRSFFVQSAFAQCGSPLLYCNYLTYYTAEFQCGSPRSAAIRLELIQTQPSRNRLAIGLISMCLLKTPCHILPNEKRVVGYTVDRLAPGKTHNMVHEVVGIEFRSASIVVL